MTYTKNHVAIACALTIAPLLLVACGDSPAPAPTENASTSELAQVICSRQAACCAGNDAEATCRATYDTNLAKVAAMRGLELSASKLSACVAKYEAMDCETIAAHGGRPAYGVLCADLLAGDLADGEACGSDDLFQNALRHYQCASGYCSSKVCRGPHALGDSCELGTNACEAGSRCYQGTCVTEHKQGEACGDDGFCESGTDCFGPTADTDTWTCQEPTTIAVGETCEQGKLCVLGEGMCAFGVCGKNSLCKP